MSKRGAAPAQFTPTPGGWRLHRPGEPPLEAATLAELAPQVPGSAPVELALPCFAVLLERLTLPATDAEELTGMIQLHLEKTLPYPVEEVTSGSETIRRSETESTLLSIAVHGPVLAELCRPLREAERLPMAISLFALDVAPHLPSASRVAAVWVEQGQLAVAIYEEGKLSWAYNLIGSDAETLLADLPPLLLTAEMDGVPTRVDQVALASDCEALRVAVTEIFGVPVGVFPVAEVRPRPGLDLLPPEWAQAAQTLERGERFRQRLLTATALYLLLLAGAFVYLAWLKRQTQVLETQIAQLQPKLQVTQDRQGRWLSLDPALTARRFTVEVLYLVNRSRPEEVHITNFDTTPQQFMVEGEAPKADAAIDFAEKLRADKELSDFQIEAGPPKILPDGKAQFRIFGKL